ncbi:MAG: hypothetical protein Q8O72_14930 [Bacteroidales bacterium]|nr:hypothetical protein [Bacteroidales bacterium]
MIFKRHYFGDLFLGGGGEIDPASGSGLYFKTCPPVYLPSVGEPASMHSANKSVGEPIEGMETW